MHPAKLKRIINFRHFLAKLTELRLVTTNEMLPNSRTAAAYFEISSFVLRVEENGQLKSLSCELAALSRSAPRRLLIEECASSELCDRQLGITKSVNHGVSLT